MATGIHNRTIDTLLQLWDGTDLTASGYLQVSGSAGQVDLGGATVKGTATTARMACGVNLVLTTIDTDDGDENYLISVVGSNSATFASGNKVLATLEVGDKDATLLGVAQDSDNTTTGRYLIPFINERAGTVFRYVRVYVQCAGVTTNALDGLAYLTIMSEFPSR